MAETLLVSIVSLDYLYFFQSQSTSNNSRFAEKYGWQAGTNQNLQALSLMLHVIAFNLHPAVLVYDFALTRRLRVKRPAKRVEWSTLRFMVLVNVLRTSPLRLYAKAGRCGYFFCAWQIYLTTGSNHRLFSDDNANSTEGGK